MNKHTSWSKKIILVFLVCLTITFVILTLQQKSILKKLKAKKLHLQNATTEFETVLEDKKQLIEKKELADQKLKKFKKLENNQHAHCSLFQEIQSNLGPLGTLKSLDLEKKKIAMSILYPTIKKADRFMKTLNELPYVACLKLQAVHPDGNNLLFTITGKFAK